MEREGAATASCRWQAAYLQLLSTVTNFTVRCCCVENYLRSMKSGHGSLWMMENGQLLTDIFIKTTWICLAALQTDIYHSSEVVFLTT